MKEIHGLLTGHKYRFYTDKFRIVGKYYGNDDREVWIKDAFVYLSPADETDFTVHDRLVVNLDCLTEISPEEEAEEN